MRSLKVLFGMLLVAFLLAGCATTGGNGQTGEKVKCPACGYEFNKPIEPHP